MKSENQTMQVRAICNGTVIDHIPPGALFKVIELLGLTKSRNELFFATNLVSKKIGTKAMIKIVDTACSDKQISYLALVAPMARISTIQNYEVIEKRQIEAPTEVCGFVRCANPMCITNHQAIATKFNVGASSSQLNLRCAYCEKTTLQSQIEIIKHK